MAVSTGPKISCRARRHVRTARFCHHLLGAEGALRAFLLAGLDHAEHLHEMGVLDQRADLGSGLERMGQRDLAGGDLLDLLDQRVHDRTLGYEPGRGVAGFASIVEAAPGRSGRGGIEVGIGEDDKRRLAAEFERDALEVGLGGVAHDQLADFGRAGEGDHVDIHVLGERLASLLAIASDNIEHAGGQACLMSKLGDADGRER
jgi:hypothetical protein